MPTKRFAAEMAMLVWAQPDIHVHTTCATQPDLHVPYMIGPTCTVTLPDKLVSVTTDRRPPRTQITKQIAYTSLTLSSGFTIKIHSDHVVPRP